MNELTLALFGLPEIPLPPLVHKIAFALIIGSLLYGIAQGHSAGPRI